MELTSKTRKQFVLVDNYRCYYIIFKIFYTGIKFRVLLMSRVFNFAIFLHFYPKPVTQKTLR